MIPMRGVTDRQEMESWKKKMKERAEKLAGLFGSRQRDGERGLSTSPWFGMEGRGGFLCALFRAEVLTEGP